MDPSNARGNGISLVSPQPGHHSPATSRTKVAESQNRQPQIDTSRQDYAEPPVDQLGPRCENQESSSQDADTTRLITGGGLLQEHALEAGPGGAIPTEVPTELNHMNHMNHLNQTEPKDASREPMLDNQMEQAWIMVDLCEAGSTALEHEKENSSDIDALGEKPMGVPEGHQLRSTLEDELPRQIDDQKNTTPTKVNQGREAEPEALTRKESVKIGEGGGHPQHPSTQFTTLEVRSQRESPISRQQGDGCSVSSTPKDPSGGSQSRDSPDQTVSNRYSLLSYLYELLVSASQTHLTTALTETEKLSTPPPQEKKRRSGRYTGIFRTKVCAQWMIVRCRLGEAIAQLRPSMKGWDQTTSMQGRWLR